VPDEPVEGGRPGGARSPGWREALLVAGATMAGIFALELASAAFPPVREAFRAFPLIVVFLVGATAGLLALALRRRSRP
jgi:hypothetical protein